MKTQTTQETVGRKYNQTRWGVHSRRIGGDGIWYGRNNYKTEEDAREHFRKCAGSKPKRYENIGGMVLDFGNRSGEEFEFRIVRVEMQCEVVEVGEGLV